MRHLGSKFLQNAPRTQTHAFTLVELLTVIAVIAILAVLLTSGLSGIMNKARRTRDVSAMRQIGTALLGFSADHNGVFPTAGATIRFDSVDATTGLPSWAEQIESYLGHDRKLFSTQKAEDSPDGIAPAAYFLGGHAAYAAAAEAGESVRFQPVRMVRIQMPSKYVLLGEIAVRVFEPFDADPDNFTQDPAFYPGGASGPEASIFFADGHVGAFDHFDPAVMMTTYE